MGSLDILAKAAASGLSGVYKTGEQLELIINQSTLPEVNFLGLGYDDHPYCCAPAPNYITGICSGSSSKNVFLEAIDIKSKGGIDSTDHSYSGRNKMPNLDNFSSCSVLNRNHEPILVAGRKIASGDILMFCKNFSCHWMELFKNFSNLSESEPPKIKLPHGFLSTEFDGNVTADQDVQFAQRSMNPNAVVYAHVVNNSLQLYLIAKRKIKQNEEISVAMYKERIQPIKVDTCSETDEGDENVISSSGDVTPSKATKKARKRKHTPVSESQEENAAVSPDSTTKIYGNINWNLNRSKITSKTDSGDSGTEVSPKPKKPRITKNAKSKTANKPAVKMSREEKKLQHYVKMFEKLERQEKRKDTVVKSEDEDLVSSTTEIQECSSQNPDTQLSANSSSEEDRVFQEIIRPPSNQSNTTFKQETESSVDGIKTSEIEDSLSIDFRDLHFKKRQTNDAASCDVEEEVKCFNDTSAINSNFNSIEGQNKAKVELVPDEKDSSLQIEDNEIVTENKPEIVENAEVSSAAAESVTASPNPEIVNKVEVKLEPQVELESCENYDSDSSSSSSSSSSNDNSDDEDKRAELSKNIEQQKLEPQFGKREILEPESSKPSTFNRTGKNRSNTRTAIPAGKVTKSVNKGNSSAKTKSETVLAKYHHRYATAPKSKYLTRGNLVKESKEVEEKIVPLINSTATENERKETEKSAPSSLKCIKMKKMFLNEWINEQAQEKVEVKSISENDENSNILKSDVQDLKPEILPVQAQSSDVATPRKISTGDSYITSAKKRWLQKAIESTEQRKETIKECSETPQYARRVSHRVSDSYEGTENNNNNNNSVQDSTLDNVFFEPPVSTKKKMSLSEYKKRRKNDDEDIEPGQNWMETNKGMIYNLSSDEKGMTGETTGQEKQLLMPLEAIKNRNNLKPGHREPQSLQERKKIIQENAKRELERLKLRHVGTDGIENLRRELAEEKESALFLKNCGSNSDVERSPLVSGGSFRSLKVATPRHVASNIENDLKSNVHRTESYWDSCQLENRDLEVSGFIQTQFDNNSSFSVKVADCNVTETIRDPADFHELVKLEPAATSMLHNVNEQFTNAATVSNVKKKKKKRPRIESPPPPPPPPLPAAGLVEFNDPELFVMSGHNDNIKAHPAQTGQNHQAMTQQVLVAPAPMPCSSAVLLPNPNCAMQAPANQFAVQAQQHQVAAAGTGNAAMLQSQQIMPIPLIIHSANLAPQPAAFILHPPPIQENKQ